MIAKFNSIREWKNYCFSTHILYLKNPNFRIWINKKYIDIFNFSNLRQGDIDYIKLGIEDAIKIPDLHFKINYSNDTYLQKMINSKSNYIDSNKIVKIIIKERMHNHKGHAAIFLVNKPIKSPSGVIIDGEALTYVPEGIIFFTFKSSKNYPHAFLRCRAKHETLHLLGLNLHHEDIEVYGYGHCVRCNMDYNATTEDLCRKCKDALVYFWKGIEYATKNKHISNSPKHSLKKSFIFFSTFLFKLFQ